MDIFRKEFGTLTEEQKANVYKVKCKAEELYDMLNKLPHGQVIEPRNMAIARTKLEEVVMWAVKSITFINEAE